MSQHGGRRGVLLLLIFYTHQDYRWIYHGMRFSTSLILLPPFQKVTALHLVPPVRVTVPLKNIEDSFFFTRNESSLQSPKKADLGVGGGCFYKKQKK